MRKEIKRPSETPELPQRKQLLDEIDDADNADNPRTECRRIIRAFCFPTALL